VPVADNVLNYAVELVSRTRTQAESSPIFVKESVRWGAGPRASQYLILAAKVKSVLEGRFTPNIEDVRYAAVPVLRHRIIMNFNAEAEGVTSAEIVKKLL